MEPVEMNPQIKQKEAAWKIFREGQSEKDLLQNLKIMDGNWQVQQKSSQCVIYESGSHHPRGRSLRLKNEIIGLQKDCWKDCQSTRFPPRALHPQPFPWPCIIWHCSELQTQLRSYILEITHTVSLRSHKFHIQGFHQPQIEFHRYGVPTVDKCCKNLRVNQFKTGPLVPMPPKTA